MLEAEETEDEDGNKLLCCDATMQSVLKAEAIDEQAEKLIQLAEKYDIIYDGWGTYYEGEDALYDDEEDEDDQEWLGVIYLNVRYQPFGWYFFSYAKLAGHFSDESLFLSAHLYLFCI